MRRPAGKHILCKVNHITDDKIIRRLYEALRRSATAHAGTRKLGHSGYPRPGEYRDQGIIDRYLEHSRIFIFCNGGRGRGVISLARPIG
ncbi:MAG: hypothetical protein ACLS37_14035 [Alistipes sp.]